MWCVCVCVRACTGVTLLMAVESKSQLLCQYTSSIHALEVTSCDCSNNNAVTGTRDSCFASAVATPVAEGMRANNENIKKISGDRVRGGEESAKRIEGEEGSNGQ